MKKSRKVSARTSYNMLPDYPYAVEVTGDSDGRRQKVQYVKSESIGASGRFDSETASEDSCSLKRKSINLNSAGQKMDALGVPTYVIAVSQMSRSEKMELRKKLKLELDQVRSAAHRIEELQLTSSGSVPTVSDGHISRLANSCPGGIPGKSVIGPGAVHASVLCQKDSGFCRQSSFASDGSKGVLRSLGKEKRTPKANQLYLNSEYVSGNDKMAQKSKVGTIGVKRGLLGRFESKDLKRQKMDPVQRKTVAEYMNQCADTLKKLRTHKFSWVFNEPVDPVKLNIPDYFQIITRPMDLGTIQSKLDKDLYNTPMEFAEDVRLTFANAMKYNPPGNDVHYMAVNMSQFFEGKWKIIEQKLAGEEVYRKLTQDVQLIPTKKQQCSNKNTETRNKPKVQPPNSAPLSDIPSQQKPKVEKCKRPMSFNEKKKLSQDLEQLPDEMPVPIITFLKEHTGGLNQNEDEIEVDIDAFDDDSLWELQNLVSNCLKEIGQGTRNAQAPAGLPNPEPVNARVGSLLESQPTKVVQQGGDLGDEYVDVGGDEMPATNFPSVDIEKDTAAVSIKCSSSSSSSSDSGSSSSDSDSGSSSGSESDADEAHSTDAPLKESVESGADCEERGNSDPETTGAKRAVSVLDEENAQPKATVSETDTHQEGESAPPERQVSPDKQIRAALLRSRFAETILKAQEKTLNQGNKGDPEKLRREREQLEKWQREEKARIQAEAKAAEAVRMKAEAEAAAEAKRKREMEREAARLQLQNMERTVEINENNHHILEVLERLRYPTAEHTPSSGDETSPVQSEDAMKAFQLQGENPLELLGLTLKKLDDEEEETTADCAAGNGDVEEGEID